MLKYPRKPIPFDTMNGYGNPRSMRVIQQMRETKPQAYFQESEIRAEETLRRSLRRLDAGLMDQFRQGEFIKSLKRGFDNLTPEQKILGFAAIGLFVFTLTSGCTSITGSSTPASNVIPTETPAANASLNAITACMNQNYPALHGTGTDSYGANIALTDWGFKPAFVAKLPDECNRVTYSDGSDVCTVYTTCRDMQS